MPSNNPTSFSLRGPCAGTSLTSVSPFTSVCSLLLESAPDAASLDFRGAGDDVRFFCKL